MADQPNGEDFVFKQVEEEDGKIKLLIYAGKPIRSEADIVDYHDIDLEYWKAAKLKARTWEVGAKVKFPTGVDTQGRTVYSTRVLKYPLHYVAVEFVLRYGSMQQSYEDIKNALDEYNLNLIKEFKKEIKPYTVAPTYKRGNLWLEMMICDLHYGKIAYDRNTDRYVWSKEEVDYHVDTAVELFLGKVDTDYLAGVIFPLGNDVIHIDNLKNSSVSQKTTMDAKALWWHLVLQAKDMYIRVISKLAATVKRVIVPVVPGNHDYYSCLSIGDSVKEHFKDYPNVEVIFEYGGYPHFEFGKCLVAWSHGNELSPNKIHTMLSIDYAEAFGRTKFRAVHAGHIHIQRKKHVTTKAIKDEEGGVDVEFCPAITPADRWHKENLFDSLKRVKAFLWEENTGIIEEYYYIKKEP